MTPSPERAPRARDGAPWPGELVEEIAGERVHLPARAPRPPALPAGPGAGPTARSAPAAGGAGAAPPSFARFLAVVAAAGLVLAVLLAWALRAAGAG
ncbi:hypothetical protein [Kineococcus sp. SYSU DK005]|uniref:hypothetical protein n=1 Tax=Kineococcus sp. SYSU DK005 TaxID=3383126 RepID=UPI003D7D323F